MSASKLKGSLLEFIVRRLLTNCGFTVVRPDGLLIYTQRGLNFINGKGASHDADVLMNPPIQMPFSYPFRINFECKAYNKKIGLPIIRNALGLRYDINEFEVVTRTHLRDRQNNRRSSLAIDNRQRFNYQVGVASVEDFTKPAFEFAANNKIPLISLRWIFPDNICNQFHDITAEYLQNFNQDELDNLLLYLKGNNNNIGRRFLESTDSIFRNIYQALIEFEERIIVGLLESGDLLFLISEDEDFRPYLRNNLNRLEARFHYVRRDLDYWTLNINQEIEFGFYLPTRIIEKWKDQNFDSRAAINIKGELFSKVFVFIPYGEFPFRIIQIDKEWLDRINNNNN